MNVPALKPLFILSLLIVTSLLSQCAMNNELSYKHPQVKARNKIIATEAYPTDTFIGRRYVIENACFWGYLRRPTQPWERSFLVAMDETSLKTPDRIPFGQTVNGKKYGYDNNYEYLVEGSYTGRYIYDSKIGIKVREFKPTKFTLLKKNAGWLFHPDERYDPKKHSLVP